RLHLLEGHQKNELRSPQKTMMNMEIIIRILRLLRHYPISTSSTDTSTVIIIKQAKLSTYVGVHHYVHPKYQNLNVSSSVQQFTISEVKALFHFLCPHVKLPERKTLAGCILKDASTNDDYGSCLQRSNRCDNRL
ncbi:7374_t:CDS:1, partial [Paraglomus occultum]